VVSLVLLRLRGMDVPFWRVQRVLNNDELDAPSRDTAGTGAMLMGRGSRLNVPECSDRQCERVETGSELLDDDAVLHAPASRPMPRCLYLERLATVLLDDGAETCRMRAGMQRDMGALARRRTVWLQLSLTKHNKRLSSGPSL
jgi:hypothetical protein